MVMEEDSIEKYINSTDDECAYYISEALFNLSDNYPFQGRAHYAFGRLIGGRLGWLPKNTTIIMPDKEHPYTRLKYSHSE